MKLGPFTFKQHHLGNYMHRWMVESKWGSIRLHHILRPDLDAHMHGHPWNFWSLILWGGYYERNNKGFSEFHIGFVNRKNAQEPHTIYAIKPNTWTLVWTGKKVRHWGFWTDIAWIPWRTYVAERDRPHHSREPP